MNTTQAHKLHLLWFDFASPPEYYRTRLSDWSCPVTDGVRLLFSIVMPCFNVADVVGRTIASVCNQTLTSFELVAIDDGSSDDTLVVLDSMRDHLPAEAKLRVLSQKNSGAAVARNRGMSEARGDLIAFLDADDLWEPGYLAAAAAIFERFLQLDALATNSWDQSVDGRRHVNVKPGSRGVLVIDDFFEAQLNRTVVVRTSGVVIRKSVARRVGDMREDLIRAQDAEYWARLAASGACWGFSEEPLVVYDGTRAQSLSRNARRFADAPSPETWSREIWPLLQPSMHKSFQKWYLCYAKAWCWLELQAELDEQARATAEEAFPRTSGFCTTAFLLAVRFVPGSVHRLVWRVGAPVKRLLRRTLRLR